jgi:hypothetical protein
MTDEKEPLLLTAVWQKAGSVHRMKHSWLGSSAVLRIELLC